MALKALDQRVANSKTPNPPAVPKATPASAVIPAAEPEQPAGGGQDV
jgi:hypothetical protein